MALNGQAPPGANSDLAILKVFLGENADPGCELCQGAGWTLQKSPITNNDITVQCPCTNDAAMEREDYDRIKAQICH